MDRYREEIKKNLAPLSNAKRLLFAILICERLYPNYVHFYNTFNWGDPRILEEAISVVFQSLINKDSIDRIEILNLIEEIELINPDADDFSDIYLSFALDACASVYSSLNFILDPELEHIVDVAICARDTVDMFIQERDDISVFTTETENEISKDLLMLAEKRRQRDSIEIMLSKDFGDVITDQLIDSLRDRTPIIDIEILE